MSSTQHSLPTGWLAPPPGLVPSNNPIKIEPIPIAISATLAFIVGAVVILLFTRKDKDVFLEDRILQSPEISNAASQMRQGGPSREDHAAQVPIIQHPVPSFTNPAGRRPAPKATAMLGVGAHNWQPDVEADRDSPLQNHKQYYDPGYDFDSDDETLQDYEKDSTYWPPPRSEVSAAYEKEMMGRYRDSDGRPRSYQDGSVRRSPFGIASNTRLGDAY